MRDQTDFLLCLLQDENQLDAMPVIKTTHYPWAGDGYRPLAYGRLAAVRGDLLVDLQAFERDPAVDAEDLWDNSCLGLSLRFGENSPVLTLVLNAGGRAAAYADGAPFSLSLDVDRYAGVDEQGWYWGLRFWLPRARMARDFGTPTLAPGNSVGVNLYKFQGRDDAHMGSAAPLVDRSIFSPRNLGRAAVIRY